MRERAVTFDVGQVQAMPARLNLNLFDDVCVVAVRQSNAEAGPVPVWNGSIEGVPGSQVTIIFNPGAAAGSIVIPPQAFNLELVRDGVYRISEVDVTRYPNELPPMTPRRRPLPGQRVAGGTIAGRDALDPTRSASDRAAPSRCAADGDPHDSGPPDEAADTEEEAAVAGRSMRRSCGGERSPRTTPSACRVSDWAGRHRRVRPSPAGP